MTGNGYCNYAAVAEQYLVTVVQYAAKRWNILVISHTKARNTLLYVLGPRPVSIVGTGLYTEGLLNECIAEYVVEVQVGVEIVLQFKPLALDEEPYAFALFA